MVLSIALKTESNTGITCFPEDMIRQIMSNTGHLGLSVPLGAPMELPAMTMSAHNDMNEAEEDMNE